MLKEEDIKKTEEIGPSRFTFNGNIIKELGEESISNPYIAVAELIKNSYDADSKVVEINFLNIDKHNPKITIADDGLGMDSSEIKDKWMDIGSPHKKSMGRTKENNRIPVGAKGIGRFASQCLGKTTKLITASKNEHFGYRLLFDWNQFKPGNKATDVDNNTQRFKKKLSTRGTTLVIENLNHNWNDSERMRDLLKDIFLLTSPVNGPKNFKIKQNISSKCPDLKKLQKKFLDKHAYCLKVKLSQNKKIDFEFYKGGIIRKKGKKELKENLRCGDTSFELYFYYRSQTAWKRWLKKEISKRDLNEIKNMLDIYGGIKLYRDHFRVKPYGDKNADWIGIDKWSRDVSMVPGNPQIFGVVNISKETNPKIQDTTTREGVFTTPEYFDLVRFVTTCISLFVDMRSEVESEKAKARKGKTSRKKTVKKEEKIEIKEPKVEEPPVIPEDIPFIDIKGDFPNSHYNQLVHEANECERNNYPNASFWMCRKITENLVFHILEKKFSDKVDLWYDTKNKRNHSFSKLIDNLYQNRDFFKPNVKDYIEQFKIDVGKFKKDVDAAIHKNYVYLSDKSELKQYKINKVIQILIEIYHNI